MKNIWELNWLDKTTLRASWKPELSVRNSKHLEAQKSWPKFVWHHEKTEMRRVLWKLRKAAAASKRPFFRFWLQQRPCFEGRESRQQQQQLSKTFDFKQDRFMGPYHCWRTPGRRWPEARASWWGPAAVSLTWGHVEGPEPGTLRVRWSKKSWLNSLNWKKNFKPLNFIKNRVSGVLFSSRTSTRITFWTKF